MDSAQGINLAPIFGDLSQNEKLSDIKQPLRNLNDLSDPVEVSVGKFKSDILTRLT